MSMQKIVVPIVLIGILAGCTPVQKTAPAPNKTLLTVDFPQGQTLRYKFVSSRDITVDWGQSSSKQQGKSKVDTTSESLEMVISYTPVEVEPYGLTTVMAKCESAKVTRTGKSPRRSARQDAAESFAGKSWIFTVAPTGKVEDRSKLYDVLRQAGQQAFRPDRSKGLIKEPDMLYDFIALQWFGWDSISSILDPAAGVGAGDEWQSVLSVPAPMILWVARNVTYQLNEIRRDERGPLALIESSYSLLQPSPTDWPIPYTERFQMSGMFGFMRNYKVLDLQGTGQELFNIDAGRTQQYTQHYTMQVQASLPLGLGVNPKITIGQTLSMTLLVP